MPTRTAMCIKVNKKSAGGAIRELTREGLIDYSLKFAAENDALRIPLMALDTGRTNALSAKGYTITNAVFQETPSRKPPSLLDALAEKLPDAALGVLPRAFDVVGDIAIVEVPESLQQYESEIGEAILRISPRLRLVLSKQGPTESEFRIRAYKRIAGHDGTKTLHREHGALLRLEVGRVYFNPRLSHEHLRVAQQVQPDETVVDMFAGIGPFAILIARGQAASRVFAVELNPDAYAYLRENVLINKVHDSVTPIQGDSKQLAETRLRAIADRVIMNYPTGSEQFLDAACKILKPKGGIVHYYSFETPRVELDWSESKFRDGVESAGRKVAGILERHLLREVAPYRYLHVLDGRVS